MKENREEKVVKVQRYKRLLNNDRIETIVSQVTLDKGNGLTHARINNCIRLQFLFQALALTLKARLPQLF